MNRDAVNHVIAAFGGVAGLIEAAGGRWPLSATNIYKWRSTGRIPQSWGLPLQLMADKQGVTIDHDKLLAAIGIERKAA